MNSNKQSLVVGLGILVLSTLTVLLFVEQKRLSELLQEQAIDAAEAKAQIEELANRVEVLSVQLANAETESRFRAGVSPLILESGIYTLAAVDEGARFPEEAYSIYHSTVSVGTGGFRQKLQIGLARAGLTDWQVYFDYNNDGLVDNDMSERFASEIPMVGGFVAGALDGEMAQRVYSRILASVESAEYVAPGQVTAGGGAVVSSLWSGIQSMSDSLGNWVAEAAGFADPLTEADSESLQFEGN